MIPITAETLLITPQIGEDEDASDTEFEVPAASVNEPKPRLETLLVAPHASEDEDASDTEFEVLAASMHRLNYFDTKNLSQLLSESSLAISFGRKGTSSINFKAKLSPFIASHYHEDPERFSKALDRLTHARLEATCLLRSESGLCAIRTYYNLLTTIERRFFDASGHPDFSFSWTDAFTEDTVNQRSPAFEKASLIFNYAACCAHLACSRKHKSEDGLLDQIQWFVQARANLQVLRDCFPYAPSCDSKPELLEFLIRIMQLQAQESVLALDMLECGNGSKVEKLVKYIGCACRLIKGYGKLASTAASTYDTEVTRAVPSYWMELLKVKSQYYYAQINHKLAIILLCLAANGKVPDSGRVELKPFSEDVFLEAEVAWQLKELFTLLEPCVKPRRHRRLRRRSSGSTMDIVINVDDEVTDRSCDTSDIPSLGRRFSSELATSVPNLGDCGGREVEGEQVSPPSNRKDAHLLGQVCLTEALHWARLTLRTINESSILNCKAKFKNFVDKCVKKWAEQLECVTRSGSGCNTDSSEKPLNRLSSAKAPTTKLFMSAARDGSSSGAVAAQEVEENPWMVPTFLPIKIKLPKVMSCNVLTSGRNMLPESEDPFRGLGPLSYFNAHNKWSEPYTVQLVRDEMVDYGFGVRDEVASKVTSLPLPAILLFAVTTTTTILTTGNSPVEIIDVEADCPAYRNGMREGDRVVGINGMDARFMTLDQVTVAVRFGATGYDRANRARAAAATATTVDRNGANEKSVAAVAFPPKVDTVSLTLIRPIRAAAEPNTSEVSISTGTLMEHQVN
ncbi:unnamed protein product [Taenia asiatica]|uniref:BRO1 domain-containing protein n=1 Tax=Taenia asiatica TaxID=60517 RepID=A0A0R3WDR7_TAEAS|nr:unnamed protein product [Taenia asiatica]